MIIDRISYKKVYPIELGINSKDLTGKIFSWLTIVKLVGKSDRGNVWECLCDCGNYTVATTGKLMEGKAKSCGCKKGITMGTHRMTGTSVYGSWQAMKTRCLNPNYPGYEDYGGRGITICERWLKFENFFEDMGYPPSENHSIERMNNELGYYKENCKWGTDKEQARNKRNNSWIEFNGSRKLKRVWAEELGIHYTRINHFIKAGYTFEQIYNHYKNRPLKYARLKKSLCS